MSCAGKGELIARYIMDELSASSRAELEEHIRECPSCRTEYLFAERLEDSLVNQQLAPVPSGLEEGILAAVDSVERKSVESRIIEIARNRRRLTFGRDLLPVIATSAAAAIVSILIVHYSPDIPGLVSRVGTDVLWGHVIATGVPSQEYAEITIASLAVSLIAIVFSLLVDSRYVLKLAGRRRGLRLPF